MEEFPKGEALRGTYVSGAVSIVIPTHNRWPRLRCALDGVLSQRGSEDEVIVVDDASSDETVQALRREYAESIRLYVQQENAGPAAARNQGIQRASGEFIAFLDSDDEWRPGRLQKCREVLLQQPDVVAVACGSVCPEDPVWSYGGPGSGVLLDLMPSVAQQVPNASCWMVRTNAAREVRGFSEDIARFEDWEFILKLVGRGRILYLDEPLVIYHKSPDSLLANEAGYVSSLRRILERHSGLFARYPLAYAHYANLLGQSLCREGQMKAGRAWFQIAMKTAPRKPRSWSNWLMSWLGADVFRLYVGLARSMRRHAGRHYVPTGTEAS